MNLRGSADPMLHSIHLALAGGVLLFAAVVFGFVGPGSSGVDASLLRWIWLVVSIGAVFGAGIARAKGTARDARPVSRRTALILIWALAEGQALLGLAAYLITGDPVPGAVGLVVFLYLWVKYRPSVFPSAESPSSGSSFNDASP